MSYVTEPVWDGQLAENALNYSVFFQYAEFIFVKWPSKPDWSVEGDAIEIDGDLLVTLEPGVKRRIDLFDYLETSSTIAIPYEYSRSGFLMELVMQSSFSVNLQIFIVKPANANGNTIDWWDTAQTLFNVSEALNGNVLPILQNILRALPSGNLLPATNFSNPSNSNLIGAL